REVLPDQLLLERLRGRDDHQLLGEENAGHEVGQALAHPGGRLDQQVLAALEGVGHRLGHDDLPRPVLAAAGPTGHDPGQQPPDVRITHARARYPPRHRNRPTGAPRRRAVQGARPRRRELLREPRGQTPERAAAEASPTVAMAAVTISPTTGITVRAIWVTAGRVAATMPASAGPAARKLSSRAGRALRRAASTAGRLWAMAASTALTMSSPWLPNPIPWISSMAGLRSESPAPPDRVRACRDGTPGPPPRMGGLGGDRG